MRALLAPAHLPRLPGVVARARAGDVAAHLDLGGDHDLAERQLCDHGPEDGDRGREDGDVGFDAGPDDDERCVEGHVHDGVDQAERVLDDAGEAEDGDDDDAGNKHRRS